MKAFVSINHGFGGAEMQFDKLYADLAARSGATWDWRYERHDIDRAGWWPTLRRILRVRRGVVVYNMSVLGIGVAFLILLRLLGNRILLYPHVVVSPAKSRPRLWLLRMALQRLSAALSTHVVAISDGNLFELEAFVQRDKMTVVYNYVDCENDRPFEARPLNRAIAVIGRLQDKHKQQLSLVRRHGEFLRANGLVLHLFGSGPDEAALRSHVLANGLESHVVFHGWQDEEAIYAHDFSFVLNASRWEGMPLSVLEALYHDRIVLASDIHGNRELVYGNFLFKDDADLRQLLGSMVRDREVEPALLAAQKRRLQRRCRKASALTTVETLLDRLTGKITA